MPSTMARSKAGWIKKVLLPLLFWIAVWQLAAFLVDRNVGGRGNELLLPYPLSVGKALLRLCQNGEFWQAALLSLGRILMGLVMGTAAGALLAVVTCASHWGDALLAPAIRVVRATPITSFILLILLWTGKDRVPMIIAALMVIPVVWENLAQGIRSTDPQLLEMAKAYRFSPWKTARLIYWPTIVPYFGAAVTTAMGLAWKSGVAAEVISLPKLAIGTEIYQSKLYLEIPDLFAWTLVVILLSMVLEGLLKRMVHGKKEVGTK